MLSSILGLAIFSLSFVSSVSTAAVGRPVGYGSGVDPPCTTVNNISKRHADVNNAGFATRLGVGSNKTLIGNSGIHQHVWGGDGILISDASNVWIGHNYFKNWGMILAGNGDKHGYPPLPLCQQTPIAGVNPNGHMHFPTQVVDANACTDALMGVFANGTLWKLAFLLSSDAAVKGLKPMAVADVPAYVKANAGVVFKKTWFSINVTYTNPLPAWCHLAL
ncbi:hypothetical protein L218DRAFT_949569 [Marasmius fiardii PR-910]|nr:hypothetical protein L218DRAFT_949569 [Marasmius fiardii PR-910]